MELFKRNGKRENLFIRLLRQQAEQMNAGVDGLWLFVSEGDVAGAAQAEQAEKDGDELRRILIDELHKTFITPFDRENIFDLSLLLDDVLDYAYTTAEEIQTLKVTPDQHLMDMVSRLREGAQELALAIERMDENPMVAMDHARRAKHRENQVERVYRDAIAELFSGPENVHHVMEMLLMREVYRHVSNAADQADQAANIIGSIVVKMT